MIRHAAPSDLPAISGIYEAILDRDERGPVYTNWQRGKYPTVDHARTALEAGTLYVGEDDGVLWGVVNLNGEQLPEYSDIPWAIPAEPDQVGVIHTLCIHPDQSGKGLARRMVAFCEEEFRALGCDVTVATADGSRGVRGFVTTAIAERTPDFDYFYACGPLPGLSVRRGGGVFLHGLRPGDPELLRKGPLNPLGPKVFRPLLTVG